MAVNTKFENLKKVVGGVRTDAGASTADGDTIAVRVDEYGQIMTVAGSGGTTTAYEEDTPHVTGDYGTQVLAVRNDTLATLSDTDGDYSPLQVDANGALYVNIGGEAIDVDVEGAAAQDAAVTGNPLQIAFESATVDGLALPNAVGAEGDVVRPKASLQGVAYASLVNADGSKAGLLVEDAVHASGDLGVQVLAVRNDTIGSLVTTDGDYSPLQVDADGALYVSISGETIDLDVEGVAAQDAVVSGNPLQIAFESATVDGSALPNAVNAEGDVVRPKASIQGVAYASLVNADGSKAGFLAEDAAHVSEDLGVQVLAVRNDVLASLSGTDGDYSPIQVDADGAVWTSDRWALGEDTAHVTGDFGTQVLAVRNDTLASLSDTDGDYSPIQVDADGAVWTADRWALAEDSAHVSGDFGTQVLAVRNDVLASLSGTDGDYSPIQVDADGAVWVRDKAYDSVSASNSTSETNPLDLHYTTVDLVDTTNKAAATTNYPSDSGLTIDGYKAFSISGALIDADGTIDLRVYVTNDEDATPANRDWIQIYGNSLDTNTTINEITVTNASLYYAWAFEDVNFKYLRVQIENSGATNTIRIKARLRAL